MKEVAIKGITYKLRYSLRMYFIFENLVERPADLRKTADIYMLMYCCLLANNDNFAMSFDEFIDECDNDSTIFPVFMELFSERAKILEGFEKEDSKDSEKKKK